MSNVPVTVAVAHYDHVIDLALGRHSPIGVDLTTLIMPIEDIFQRFEDQREWHVSEYSFAKYVAGLAIGDDSLRAIPVFPSRMFRTGSVFVRADSEMLTPGDLVGSRVGIPEWVQTAGVYLRDWLVAEGIDLRQVSWVQGGVNQGGRRETVSFAPPEGIEIGREQNRTLQELLFDGEIDAIATAHPPTAFEQDDPRIRQLLADPTAAAWSSWDRTGVYPIMHAIVVKAELLEAHPWVGSHLYRSFLAARDASIRRLSDLTASRVPVPFAQDALDHAVERMGPVFPYGVEANRATLESFLRAAFDQGVTRRRVEVDELFHPGCEAGALV